MVPAGGDGDRPGFLATFHAPGGFLPSAGGRVPVAVYVDITTPAVWDGPVLRAVDLDLDVVRGTSGRVWVDDEDEFADHRVRWGYPAAVAEAAVRTCGTVEAAVRRHEPPFDGETHLPWLDRVAAH
ncbi:DUF402 domain-containing protein [Nocardioides coralli]|nr:DUF402 domain-containing protein [Nocardioides coralli]